VRANSHRIAENYLRFIQQPQKTAFRLPAAEKKSARARRCFTFKKKREQMKVKLARIAFMTIPLSFFPGVVFYLCAHTARSGAPAAPTEV